MNLTEFGDAIGNIYSYFQVKIPDDGVKSIWFESVKHIQSGPALRQIVKTIQDLDNLPKNMPKAFKAAWQTWLNSNPEQAEKLREKYKSHCDYCGGTGFIYSKKKELEVNYNYISRCPKCKNWALQVSEESMPAYAKEELWDFGFDLVEGPKVDNSKKFKRDLGKLKR